MKHELIPIMHDKNRSIEGQLKVRSGLGFCNMLSESGSSITTTQKGQHSD